MPIRTRRANLAEELEASEAQPIEGSHNSPPHSENPAEEDIAGDGLMKDAVILKAVKPQLDKFLAVYRKRIQKLDENIARKLNLMSDLYTHVDNGTIPKSIVVPRMPQIAEALKEKYSPEYKAMSEEFANKSRDFLVKAKEDEIKLLNAERKKLINEAMAKSQEVFNKMYFTTHNLEEAQSIAILTEYQNVFKSRLDEARMTFEVKQTVGQAIEEEKKHASLLKKTAAEADEAEASEEVNRLRKDVQALKKEVFSLSKAVKNPKASKKTTGQKPEGGKAKKANGKPKPKNGKRGAAERGAKQN